MGKIGIFDSGIGGVTVLKELFKILPKEDYIYYSDSIHNPYGDKSNEDIIKYSETIVKFFIKENCKAVVIACNTASAIAAEYLRNKYYNLPIIAIEPAYKMVYDNAFDKNTLIMATKATISSEKFNILYNKYNNNKTQLLACAGLAELIEKNDENKINEYLNNNLKEYKNKIDNVVLGCTHYPLIKRNITKILGDVKFFDGSPNVALRLKKILEEKKLLENNNGEIEFIDSQNLKIKKDRFFEILNN